MKPTPGLVTAHCARSFCIGIQKTFDRDRLHSMSCMGLNRRCCILLLFFAVLTTIADPASGAYEVEFEYNVEMKTRDGVTLRADIYRPKAGGKFPVLLERNPYNKYIYIGDGLASAARGYVFIVQDARGRFASDGEWYPFRDEGKDGYDAVEWAAALPYSNGKVGMVGISYCGCPELLTAMAAPPHLVAIYPGITASNYHDNWAYQGGAFALMFSRGWCSGLATNEASRRPGMTIPSSYWELKRTAADRPLVNPGPPAGLAQYYFDWVAHPSYDDYWKQWSIEEHYDQIKVPALHFGAWYDLFMPGAIRNYVGIKNHGGSDAARRGQRLVLIPGGHAGFGQKIGDVDFGNDSIFNFRDWGLRWFDWVMKGIDNGMSREKPVRIFVMGKNIWRDEDDWPLARAVATRYFLHSQGKANTRNGDGKLDTNPPNNEPDDKYIYDPAEPVPTHGGMMPCDNAPSGPVDQAKLELRDDILIYTTPAFEKETEVTGTVSLELFVSSSTVDTDFTGKLVDVWPTGFAQNLAEGILRARYRDSFEKAELMKPGETYKVTVDLGATSNVFLVGHKLRLEVASSNYPRFDRNLNTGGGPEDTATIKATNVIHHDAEWPSALIIPVIR